MDRGHTFFFNGWSQDIFFTHGQGQNIFFCQNQSQNIFFKKNPGPPRESNGRSLIDASWRVNSFMYLGRSPAFHLVFFSKYCVFVFPSQVFSIFFLKKLFSWLEFISPVFISCVFLFIFSFILLVVSFHPFFVLSSIILLVSFSGCLCSFFSMLSLF